MCANQSTADQYMNHARAQYLQMIGRGPVGFTHAPTLNFSSARKMGRQFLGALPDPRACAWATPCVNVCMAMRMSVIMGMVGAHEDNRR